MREILVAVVLFVSCTQAQESYSDIFYVIRLYFKNEPALHTYFCHQNDALRFAKVARHEGISVNARTIPSSAQVQKDISAGKETVHHWGIFVDTRCAQGVDVVLECTKMFNATFSWLLWTENVDDSLKYLEASRVSADSRVALVIWKPGWDQPLMMDVYRVHVNATFRVINLTASWMDDSISWHPSRMDLSGYKFKASTVFVEFPFLGRRDEIDLMDPNYKMFAGGFRRFCYIILNMLSQYFNFDYDVKVYKKWHTIYPNGTATGMLKDLVLATRDFGFAPSKYLARRLDFASFLGVLGRVTYFFAFRQPAALGSVSALVAPMSIGAWFGLLCICVVCGFILWLVLTKDVAITHPYKWNDSFFVTVSSIAQQGVEEIAGKASTKIALVTIFAMAFIVNILYNTSVLNGLLIKAPDAIQNIEQLLRSDLKIICNDIGYLRDQMELPDSLTRRFKEKMMKNENPFNKLEEGILLVNTGAYAFYVLDDELFRIARQLQRTVDICSISNLQKERSFPTGIFGVKDSPYMEHFRRGIFYLQEAGIIARFYRLFRANKPDCMWTLEADSFGLKPLSLAYIVFGSGFLTSFIIFTVEWVHNKNICRRFKKTIVSKGHE